MSTLSLRHLSKSYGHLQVVKDLELEVESGELISLLGPSGCGKTTTLQMIAGFASPTSGSVFLEGEDITRRVPEKRDMGLVFQSYALFPHMTASQNISFGLEMRKMQQSQIRDRIEEALQMVRLSGLGDRYPSQLSGGQRQRVAIARVLAIRPRVLLLDEPMSNLDAKLRGEMHVELRALQRRLGITTILVTHDQVEAMTMSDKIAVMAHGEIVELGSPRDVYDRPASEFVYRFLGHANVIEGEISSKNGDSASVRVGSVTLPVEVDKPVGSKLKLCIRPERLQLGSPDESSIRARVVTRLFLGGVWFYELESDVGSLRATTPNTGADQPGEGSTVGVTWNRQDMQAVAPEMANV
jgi:putative spermidine/putrescine transport system ATP-binding protein